jgi:hypothetical protein
MDDNAKFKTGAAITHRMRIQVLLAAWAVMFSVCKAEARILYDFERPEDLAALDIRGDSMQPLRDYISLDGRYATSGKYALRIQVPAWEEGMRDALWMHLALPRGEGEMGRYDRLIIDATRPRQPFPG